MQNLHKPEKKCKKVLDKTIISHRIKNYALKKTFKTLGSMLGTGKKVTHVPQFKDQVIVEEAICK
jgi:hypothetical protein